MTWNGVALVRAHPRSRGENRAPLDPAHTGAGSSPLTRGKRSLLFLAFAWLGLIPAHAGKTSRSPALPSIPGAHPRSRGENLPVLSALETMMGSSPLTRGKRKGRDLRDGGAGLIPAHAGKTRTDHGRRNRPRAHPRSRGENCRPPSSVSRAKGSSPLTRGKLIDVLVGQTRSGLIPAHAGKTYSWRFVAFGYRAHPRSRGENEKPRRLPRMRVGSSPLTRGKLASGVWSHRHGGLIPAHAGKTPRIQSV